MKNTEVLVRIYDMDDQHLEDIYLDRRAAVFISPGAYLSECSWAKGSAIRDAYSRRVLSVGSERENLKQKGRDDAYVTVWVDAG